MNLKKIGTAFRGEMRTARQAQIGTGNDRPMSTGGEAKMGRVVFGIHTGAMKKWVSEKEANSIKAFFGVKPNEPLTDEMSLYSQGITKLWIEEVRGKTKPRFYLHITVNFA